MRSETLASGLCRLVIAESVFGAFIERRSKNSYGPTCMSARSATGEWAAIIVRSTLTAPSYFPPFPVHRLRVRSSATACETGQSGRLFEEPIGADPGAD